MTTEHNNDSQFEQTLQNELSMLEREMQPSRNLWPGIDHAINSNTVTLPRWFVIAASIVLVMSVTLSGGLYVNRPETNDNNEIAEFIAFLQSEHERNKQTLLVEYAGQTPLAPDWEQQMQQLELAEQAIYTALREDPENIELLKILRQVQNKQIALIDSVFAPLFSSI